MSENKTAAELAAETKALVDRAVDNVKAVAEEALATAKEGKSLSEGLKDRADNAITTANEVKGLLTALEQRIAAGNGGADDNAMTAGERFVNDETFKSFAGQTRPKGRLVVEVKDITSLTTDAAGSAGALIPSDRRGLQVELPQRRLTVRSLLLPGNTASNQIEYEQEKLFTNNAAPVAEGTLKPQSELQFEDKTANVRTIAHWVRTSVQILADAPGLRSIIDQRLRYPENVGAANTMLMANPTVEISSDVIKAPAA